MSGYRQLHTKMWSDTWFTGLRTELKILFIYLFSNERASVCGLYELPVRTISFETGLDREVIKKGLEVFNNADKVKYDFEAGVVWVRNMLKYQGSTSPKVKARIQADIKAVPECDLKKRFLDTLSIPYRYGSGTSSSSIVPSIVIDQSIAIDPSQPPPENKAAGPPNVFQVYAQNIGAITPMIAEALEDAEKTDGAEWVVAAIDEAVRNNARSWQYCLAILQRWRRDGFRVDNRRKETDKMNTVKGKLSPQDLQAWIEKGRKEAAE
jgi:DnaD/phage-associated family protein